MYTARTREKIVHQFLVRVLGAREEIAREDAKALAPILSRETGHRMLGFLHFLDAHRDEADRLLEKFAIEDVLESVSHEKSVRVVLRPGAGSPKSRVEKILQGHPDIVAEVASRSMRNEKSARDYRCTCGSLLAVVVESGIEFKCRRCRRHVHLSWESLGGALGPAGDGADRKETETLE